MLSQIDTFGDVAAEQDAVLEYFLRTDAVTKIESRAYSIVLGRKGSGKTALAKYFSNQKGNVLHVPLTLREYPWALHESRGNLGASPIESHITSWKYVIAVETMKALLGQAKNYANTDSKTAAYNFLTDNYGGVNPSLSDVLRPASLKLKKTTFSPTVLGNSIGAVEFEAPGKLFAPGLEALILVMLKCCETMASQEGISNVFLHLDELDQGLSEIDPAREALFVGLILATRAIKDSIFSKFLSPIAYMRTDIWEQMSFSDKNKINRSTALRLEWDAASLYDLINVRICSKLGPNMTWVDIEDNAKMRGAQSKWNHIISRTFMRPRDVIQFCNSALTVHKGSPQSSDLFTNKDIVSARDDYSPYLKEELDDEINPHWRKWDEALQAISSISTMTFDKEQFDAAYNMRRSSANDLDTDDALKRLFEFSVIGYRGGIGYGGSKWRYRYLDPQAGWDAGASTFKVHAGLKEYAKLQEERAAPWIGPPF